MFGDLGGFTAVLASSFKLVVKLLHVLPSVNERNVSVKKFAQKTGLAGVVMICILFGLSGNFSDNGSKVPFTRLTGAEYLVQ